MRRSPRPHSVLSPQSSVLLLLLLTGCNVVGPVAQIVGGPPTVEAVYKPAREPMVVVVENFQHPSDAYADAEMLARTLHDELDRENIAPLVPMEKLYALRANRPADFHKMSIAAIGKELGAKQVLYVDLEQASIEASPGSDMLRGKATVLVRVVDTETGRSRWPKDIAEGYPVNYESPPPRYDVAANESVVRNALYRGLAVRIGQLFHKWTPGDGGPQG